MGWTCPGFLGMMPLMAVFGRIRRRLALAIVLTALIPVIAAIWLSEVAIRQTSARFFVPEIGVRLDQSLGLYQELAQAVKTSMRHQASAIAASGHLRDAALRKDKQALDRELRRAFAEHPGLVSLTVEDHDGRRLARVDRGRPIDPEKEHRLRVARPLTNVSLPEGEEAAELIAVFAADKARFNELSEMSQFVDTYRKVEQRRRADENSYMLAVTALLGITIVLAISVGAFLARSVSSRVDELGAATRRVAAGDLSVRVPVQGSDEIADFSRAFNRMLNEVESSRARIEYLQRIGAWQEMARRLAHEIKNPLTPIQLAVQEIHRRYSAGKSADYERLLDTTLEIVEDEVGTLRRLVSEFSDFARLPQAALETADLAQLLRELGQQVNLTEDAAEEAPGAFGESEVLWHGAEIRFEVFVGEAMAYLDRQMFRRALLNLLRNATQAVAAPSTHGSVRVQLVREGDFWLIHVDDNGPGIAPELEEAIFDPYVTSKTDGTGLGLAIVKKIVIEHGGSISATKSPLGGARMSISLPVAGTSVSDAALRARELGPPPSSRPLLLQEHEPR